MTEEQANAFIREFLSEHPEHLTGCRQATVGGKDMTVLDTATAQAFGRWAIRKGYTRSPQKAERFVSWFGKNFKAEGGS